MTFNTHKSRYARQKRKKLGDWNACFATAVWTTKEGQEIQLRDMGDEHLSNTIKFLLRHAASRQIRENIIFFGGPQPSGDAASDAYEKACFEQGDKDLFDYVQDIYWYMEQEYKLRGLSEITEYISRLNNLVIIKTIKAVFNVPQP